MWSYNGPTYNKEHLEDAQHVAEEERTAERKRSLLALRGERNEAVMIGDIEAADRWSKELVNFEAADQRAAEYEAQQRAARGPWIVKVDDEPNESLWTSEEFAEMKAATRAESERRRQAAWNLLNSTKRSRNS